MSEYIGGLVQEICNSIANALELSLSCTTPLICGMGALGFEQSLSLMSGSWICQLIYLIQTWYTNDYHSAWSL